MILFSLWLVYEACKLNAVNTGSSEYKAEENERFIAKEGRIIGGEKKEKRKKKEKDEQASRLAIGCFFIILFLDNSVSFQWLYFK